MLSLYLTALYHTRGSEAFVIENTRVLASLSHDDSLAVGWTELVERQRPLFTLRVEYLFEELSAHEEDLAAAGIKLNWEFREAAQGVRHDINASSMRYSIEKPMIAPAQYRALPKDLAYALTAYCFRYRYRMPGAEDYTHISAV